jgi:hypothetical protein
MRCRSLALLAGLGLALIVGCGGGDGAKTTSPQAAASGAVPSDPIARVVYEFFDAVRQGKTAEANQRLTPLALQRITELDMNIAPPGSPTARFEVGAVKTRENDHALVELTWTDVDADGNPYQEPILCELRVNDGQWRICGMAQDLGPGQPPMVMDFESLEGIAPQQTAAGQGAAPGAATPGQAPAGSQPVAGAPEQGKEIARDPFQQPVQR